MRIKMIREPILLYETLGMIGRYYRKESYAMTAEGLLARYGSVLTQSERSELLSNAAIADRFMNEACADLKIDDPDVKFFFEPFDTGEEMELNCVARVLILSLMGVRHTDFEDGIEETKRRWSDFKKKGFEILDFHMHGMDFVSAAGRAVPSLFEQIYSLDYPQKAKMDSFLALEKHEEYIDKLAGIMRPYAQRMKDAMPRLASIYASAADNWEHYLLNMPSEQVFALLRIDEKTQIHMLTEAAVSLFFFNEIGNCFDDIPSSQDELTTLYIGLAIYPQYTKAFAEQQSERVAEMMRALADPVRMNILARIAGKPNYCLSIAQEMDINAGNISRHLTLLHEYGLVTREKRDGRIYFETNIETVENTLNAYLIYLKK